MERKSFIVYLDLLDSLDELSDAQAGKLFKTIKAYHRSVAEGATQECAANLESLLKDFVNRLAFAPFRAAFERDAEKYQDRCRRMKENGMKAGRPKSKKSNCFSESQNKPNGFSENQKVQKKADNDNVNDNDIKKKNGKEKPAHTLFPEPDSNPEYARFVAWVRDNAPYCYDPSNWRTGITAAQFEALREKHGYTSNQIALTVAEIDNRKDLRGKYTNLYLTVLKWLGRNGKE